MNRLALALALLSACFAYPAHAETAVSEWSVDQQSRLRLISTGPVADGGIKAALEIELQPGFKTYWRSPGESGVPPIFDFTGSENLAAAGALFPAPDRFADAGGVSLGYHDRVILPLRVTPADPAKPVKLAVALSYGVCDKICIPATGTAALTLGGMPEPALLEEIQRWAKAVPKRLEGLGEGEPLRITAIERLETIKGSGEPDGRLKLTIATTEAIRVFAEGPQRWYLDASPAEKTGGTTEAVISLYGPRKAPRLAPCPLVFTIIGPNAAVERHVTLDECGAKP